MVSLCLLTSTPLTLFHVPRVWLVWKHQQFLSLWPPVSIWLMENPSRRWEGETWMILCDFFFWLPSCKQASFFSWRSRCLRRNVSSHDILVPGSGNHFFPSPLQIGGAATTLGKHVMQFDCTLFLSGPSIRLTLNEPKKSWRFISCWVPN